MPPPCWRSGARPCCPNASETALAETRAELAAAEAALELALGIGGCGGIAGPEGCGRTCPAEAQLAGRFLHHDGGQEESLHRIDAVVSAADAIVCQAGCVSHAAYYRLKNACKRLGKPCVFDQSPGVGSFARSLAVLGGQESASGQIVTPPRQRRVSSGEVGRQ